MKNIWVLLLLASCTIEHSEPFEIYIPNGYKLIEEQGFDSYVGRIEDGNISFHFDYGDHSDSGPMSKKTLQNLLTNDYYIESIIDDCVFGKFDKRTIKKDLHIDTIFSSHQYLQESNNEIIIMLKLKEEYCRYSPPHLRYHEIVEMNQYNFMEFEDEKVVSKIFYPKSESGNYAGIFIFSHNPKKSTRLSYYTRNYSKNNHQKILGILSEVKNKYKVL